MFRRLAETFQNNSDYIDSQQTYYNNLPNIILSPTSGLNGFDEAIKSLNSRGTRYQEPPVKDPNTIFKRNPSVKLNNLAEQCSASSLDELISIKNPNATIGCGWLYTPPNQNSPYPVVSQGIVGNSEGPLQSLDPPSHKQYFFDLQLAKRQILLDKCKALRSCSSVDEEVYKNMCGYCVDTNQGIPIDSSGIALYSDDSLGSCNKQSIITTSSKCPPPVTTTDGAAGSGPEPIRDRTCDPVNGRLSATCLYNQVISAGCSDKGTLATALANPTNPSNYISSITNSDTVKIYNRVANPPLNLDIFAQGATSIDTVLKEVRQLSRYASWPSRSALGSSARDLCLQAGSIAAYDFCNDLQDSTSAPFNMECLQKLFRKMGGQPTGTMYPNQSTMSLYNSMTTIGNVKQYLNKQIEDMNSSDYSTQKTAVLQFLGISLQKLILRVPYQQGVEVIWFQSMPGKANGVAGILRRTIENNIIQIENGSLPTRIPISQGAFTASGMIQIYDVRSTMNFFSKYKINVNSGFFIASNQPANVAKTVLDSSVTDKDGLLSNFNVQGSNTYISESCSKYFSSTPNITKLLYLNSSGDKTNTFQLSNIECNKPMPNIIPAYYSLTLDVKAPYLNFEVSPDGNTFDDTRNPGLFTNLIIQNGSPEFHNRSEERNSVPGRKGFIRITNKTSWIRLQNISYMAWGSVTFAFRLQSMPVKDTIFSFWSFNKNCILYLVPSGSSAQIKIQTNMTMNNSVSDTATNFNISIGKWYLLQVTQNGVGLDINCDLIDNIIKNNRYTTSPTIIRGTSPITTTANNGLVSPTGLCSVSIAEWLTGLPGYAQTLIFDLAWVHFYDYYDPDVVKDSKAAWQFTQYPDSPNTYKTLS